jgi:hypothetical protein
MQVQPQRKPTKEAKTTEVANELTQEELSKVIICGWRVAASQSQP